MSPLKKGADMEILQTILTGNIGTVIIVLILWKAGILKFLLNGKRNYNDGQPLTTLQDVASTVAKLEQHFNEDTTILLRSIQTELQEQTGKLDKISEGIVWIKARINGRR